jgi:hypothetical protein
MPRLIFVAHDVQEAMSPLVETADRPQAASRAERTLVTVCAFWAAALNQDLLRHVDQSVELHLAAAERAFGVIGADEARSAVRLARFRVRAAKEQTRLGLIIGALEESLTALHEPVDDLIARFARSEVLRDTSGALADGRTGSL